MSKKIENIHDLLEQYNELIINQRDKGTSFEKLMKSYFETEPLYQDLYKKVYMWSEFAKAHKMNAQDMGIDLVAEGHDGEFTAIQCKFYAANYQVQKADIDSFFTESGKKFEVDGKKRSFAQRIIISTSDKWSPPAEKALEDQTIPVIRIGVGNLEESSIDWSKFILNKPDVLIQKEKKKPRPHQVEAINKVMAGFKENNRGKLIMACGTGKTFTALKLAEKIANKNGVVLFLVPSISLLSQTLKEWTIESEEPFHAFAVCSDSKVGKNKEDMSKHDLAIPASTDTNSLIKGLERVRNDKKMVVIFSTYQSIDVVAKAQGKGLPEFDLIICDEAHRTTGATADGEEDSHFVKVHDQKFIKGKKRLYMTATPRIFGDAVKSKANQNSALLYSMDDVTLFGPEFHYLGFGKAVSDDLLTDYRVLVLAIDEGIIDPKFQKSFMNEDGEIPLEDIAKIVGCWNGLSKRLVGKEAATEDNQPMRRAVAFARSIKDSQKIVNMFDNVIHQYIATHPNVPDILKCELAHVDGTFNVLDRESKLSWLKAETPENTCRILSNARCLSEGVDVPALDAVLFLNSRDSMVDVVQSVGRIMRKADGKKFGYVILPIGIPAGIPAEEALQDNKKYKVVWQVLQALRAHDDRFDAEINKLDLNKNKSDIIDVIGVGPGTDDDDSGNKGETTTRKAVQLNLLQLEEYKEAIYAKIVAKCGSRPYWQDWADDVAKIAERHNKQIENILNGKDQKPKEAFKAFLNGIRKNLNPSITEKDAVEMLSQQLITKPVFDALFEHYKFTESNPVSQSMQSVLEVFQTQTQKEDAEFLKSFYDNVRKRVKGIKTADGRQRVIKELYDNFFNKAFKKMADRLGIVYTPIEVVDFIINSVEDVMKEEFGKSLSDKDVHILDPFTGTGTFIVRLLQSGIIKKEDLRRKFSSEIHANELVLLAYYIATINIEETYHELMGGDYVPFEGAVLTDTFQLIEKETQVSFEAAMPEIHKRALKQNATKVTAIISNPPYFAGQDDAGDLNQNESYEYLDELISRKYHALSARKDGKSKGYDSFMRAFRWASEKIGDEGVVGFVTNSSFLDSNSADGFRKALAKEFNKIYCFNLRGNQRTKGELSKKEGGKIFGGGSRAPISIIILVKKFDRSDEENKVFYHDIGDYLSREEKLKIISGLKSITGIPWINLIPNKEGDWINQRNESFSRFLNIGEKKSKSKELLFETYSMGVKTNRDSWVYNFSSNDLIFNIDKSIHFYNSIVKKSLKNPPRNSKELKAIIDNDQRNIKWTEDLIKKIEKGTVLEIDRGATRGCIRRPFCKQYVYYSKDWNWTHHLMPKFFPTKNHSNVVIYLTGTGVTTPFSSLAVNILPDFQLQANGQGFPLYYYDKFESDDLLQKNEKADKYGYVRRDAISDFALIKFKSDYKDEKITKEEIFYYVYGLLHSPTYRTKYQNDLKKMLPRIPLLKDFWGYSKTGRQLAALHLNYETVEPFKLQEILSDKAPKKEKDLYRVNEAGMKFPKEKKIEDKTTILFNPYVTIKGVPLDAYDYVVNGKSAIEWIMERYRITTDLNSKGEGSGIVNDPNEWSDDPRYIIDLLKRIVTVSVETNKLVAQLPKFELI